MRAGARAAHERADLVLELAGLGHFRTHRAVAGTLGDAGHDVRVVTSPSLVSTVERLRTGETVLRRPWREERVGECCRTV